MKKTLLILLFMYASLIAAQTYERPYVAFRPNKTASIKSVQILSKYIKVDMEYMASSKNVGGWFSISPNTKILTKNGTTAKLLKGENIEISPKKTNTTKNALTKFSLFFEKIPLDENEIFHLIENQENILSFNFYGIELVNKNMGVENHLAKNDYFLSEIPEVLQILYYRDLFVSPPRDIREFFNSLIESTAEEGNFPGIDKISSELNQYEDKKAFAFTVSSTMPNNKLMEFFFVEGENGDRINLTTVYIKDETIANDFFKSLTDWYDAEKQGNYAFRVYNRSSTKEPRVIVFAIVPFAGAYQCQIHVLTFEEYKAKSN